MLSWYQDGPTSTTWYSSLTRDSCYRRHMARQTSATIIERKTRLDGSVSEYRCEPLSLDVDRRAVLRYTMDREWVIADTGIVLRPGQITIAHYWSDRRGRRSCSMRRSSRPTSRRRGGSTSRALSSRSPRVRAGWSPRSSAKHARRWTPNHAVEGGVFPQLGVAGPVYQDDTSHHGRFPPGEPWSERPRGGGRARR